MTNPFSWLRRKAAESVVLGVADGMRAVTPDGETPPEDLAQLRTLLATASQPRQLTVAAPEPAIAATEPEPTTEPADPWMLLLDAARDEGERRKLVTSINAEIKAGRIQNGRKAALLAKAESRKAELAKAT